MSRSGIRSCSTNKRMPVADGFRLKKKKKKNRRKGLVQKSKRKYFAPSSFMEETIQLMEVTF